MFRAMKSWSRLLPSKFGHGRIALTATKSLAKTSQSLQGATMVPSFNASLIIPSRSISTSIFKAKENDGQRDSNQAQEEIMNNDSTRQKDDWLAEFERKMDARHAAKYYLGTFDGFNLPSRNDYLEALVNFDLRTGISSLDKTIEKKITYPLDSIEFDIGRLGYCLLNGSLNHQELPPHTKIVHYFLRTITIVQHSGQISFDAWQLGRLVVDNDFTYWMVVLDLDKNLWALRAAGIDKSQLEFDDMGGDIFEPCRPDPEQYVEQKDLFGPDLHAVKLCSLASLLEFRKSGQPLPAPEPCYDAKSWTSTFAIAEPSNTAAATVEESRTRHMIDIWPLKLFNDGRLITEGDYDKSSS